MVKQWKRNQTAAQADWLIPIAAIAREPDHLHPKIETIDWSSAAQDVSPFLSGPEQASLSLWTERFFADKVRRLVQALSGATEAGPHRVKRR